MYEHATLVSLVIFPYRKSAKPAKRRFTIHLCFTKTKAVSSVIFPHQKSAQHAYRSFTIHFRFKKTRDVNPANIVGIILRSVKEWSALSLTTTAEGADSTLGNNQLLC